MTDLETQLHKALQGMVDAYWTGSEDYSPPPACVREAFDAVKAYNKKWAHQHPIPKQDGGIKAGQSIEGPDLLPQLAEVDAMIAEDAVGNPLFNEKEIRARAIKRHCDRVHAQRRPRVGATGAVGR